jgi:hypothetical protein
MNIKENIDEGIVKTLEKSPTKRDEVKQKDIWLAEYLKPKFSGAINMEINKIDLEFLEDMVRKRKYEEE